MDDLDLSLTDRADLFDVLDSDCSGSISPQEFVRGILKVRGEAKKSDAVATQLAVRSMQQSQKALKEQMQHFMNQNTKKLASVHNMCEEMRREIGELKETSVQFKACGRSMVNEPSQDSRLFVDL